MTTEQEIEEEIISYLKCGAHPHLGNCLHLVPRENQDALYNLICDMQYNKIQKQIIALQVTEDVAMIVEGSPERVVFSKEYLWYE